MDKAPVVVDLGKMDLKDAPENNTADDVDMQILKNCVVSQEDYGKVLQKAGGKIMRAGNERELPEIIS